ncbi:IclR family transcriptional regulator [Robertmurraya siralis]|uniref:Glycerol operon regulatory protein n=1 Tax=Robertmurraya siralis TaxID=77777 RepID=A0A920BUX2_9BACI|nr:IclR family transcriptional regulator [Robertmurraya siralis]GIN63348.1 IclR family transcriptional regulator [Robertmurraya siralis]
MDKDVGSVQSVDRALTILEILQENSKGLGVTDLAKQLHVSKSTAHRLLMSLLKKGFVQKDMETDKYLLGLKLIEFGQNVSENLDIRKLASGYLHELVEISGETAHLAILDNNEIVYIDKIESSATIRMYSKIGKRAPLHCTGIGKAVLAFLPEEKIKQIIDENGLKKFTDKTITDKEEMLAHLSEIKRRGYSIDDEEHELGINCAAAPILNHKGEVVAGISVAGPLMRISKEKLSRIAKEVLRVSQEISRLLGR